MSEYYKSLVTDEEVIKALTRDSQAREGTLEKPKLKPNLNFLKRTVSNIVSSNNRLIAKQTNKIMKEKEKNFSYRPSKAPVRKKLRTGIVKDIFTEKIDFVRSSEDMKIETKYNPQQSSHIFRPQVRGVPNTMQLPTNEKSMVMPKTQLEVVREILIGRIVSLKSSKAASNSSESLKTSAKKQLAKKKGSKIDHISRRKDTQCSSDDEVMGLEDSNGSSSYSDSTEFSKKKAKKCVSDMGKTSKGASNLPESHKTSVKKQLAKKKWPNIDHNSRKKHTQSSSDNEVMGLGDSTDSSSYSDSTEFSKKKAKKCVSDISETSKAASNLPESHKTSVKKQLANKKGPKIDHISRTKDKESSSDEEVMSLENLHSSSSSSDSTEFPKKNTKKWICDKGKLSKASILSESHKKSAKKQLAKRKRPKINHNLRKRDPQSSSDDEVISLDQTISSSCSVSSDFSKKKTKCVSDITRSEDSHTLNHTDKSSRKKRNKYDFSSDNDIGHPKENSKEPMTDHIMRNKYTNSSHDEIVILVDSASSSYTSDSSEFSKKMTRKFFSDTSRSGNSETSSHHKSSRRKRKKTDVASDNDIGNPRGNPKKPLIDHISRNKDTQSSSDDAVIIIDDSASSSSCSDCSEFSKKKTKECDSDTSGSEDLQTLHHIDKSSRKKRKNYDVASDNDIGQPKRSPKKPIIDHTSINKDTQRCPAVKVIILDDSVSSNSCSDSTEYPKKMTKSKCKSSIKKRKKYDVVSDNGSWPSKKNKGTSD